MNFLVAQMISCYNPFETKERNLIKIYPFETKERNLIKIYSFEKGIHMKAISKMKSLILKYRHAWVLLYGLIYMPWFCYLEKRQTIHYLIHSPLDDYIPFVEYFIIPYLLWFVFLAVTGAYFFFTNRRDFYRLAAFLCSGMTIFLIVCTIFPNGLNLRPVTFPRENIFTDLVRMIYSVDTPTNVLPSIHVYNSIGAMAAIAHSTSLKKHRGVQISSYVLGILIIGIFMTYVVEPIMGGINTGVNSGLEGMAGSSKILLGLILGGMMSIDMGGPFNKAAYVFGVAQIAAGNYDIMATVMIGGMVPPCAIALATLLFKDKFTKEEREAGPTNFIMGLAFITEGAIPFAASDPLHVLPACIIGSGLAGALSMVFNCTLMAPHGGIFVFPVVGNGLMYFVALVAGTIVSAVLLGALKKKVA